MDIGFMGTRPRGAPTHDMHVDPCASDTWAAPLSGTTKRALTGRQPARRGLPWGWTACETITGSLEEQASPPLGSGFGWARVEACPDGAA